MPQKRESEKDARLKQLFARGVANIEIQKQLVDEFGSGVSNGALAKLRKASNVSVVEQNASTLIAAFDYVRKHNKDAARAFYNALPQDLKVKVDAIFN